MIGWILLGLLAVAAVIYITVDYLDRATAKKKLKEQGIVRARIREIVNDPGVKHIKLDALDEDGNEYEVEIEAQDYDADEISRGTVIYI